MLLQRYRARQDSYKQGCSKTEPNSQLNEKKKDGLVSSQKRRQREDISPSK